MSRVLVTGGAGFVGAPVVRRLLAEGHEVAVLVRPSTSLWRLEGVVERVTLVRGDLDSSAEVIAGLPWKPDACAHLAWYAEPKSYLESRENLRSLAGSGELISALLDAGCRRFVIAGTCAEYAPTDAPLGEDAPLDPRTLYAAAKMSLHLVARLLAAPAGATVAWARLFHLYGPGENEGRLVPAATRALLEGRRFPASAGDQLRDYLHVEDLAAGLAALLECGADGAFNVCAGAAVSVRAVLEEIGRATGRGDLIGFGEVPPRATWDPPMLVGNSYKLRATTGWRPRFDLASGIRQTVDWWRARC
ncbi:MAG TPA: NAD(P)-dependent oxidoreductase [Candidatus Dormibacteraeota bacterium]